MTTDSNINDRSAKYLFNASNLHVGGGVQVATSVIGEWIAQARDLPHGLQFWVSSRVDESLKDAGYEVAELPGYRVVDVHGYASIFSRDILGVREFERVFTLFGPLYALRSPKYSIVGFAQAWIVYPDNEVAGRTPFISRVLGRVKFLLQRAFFRRADLLVVELDHVANALVGNGVATYDRIRIVRNCLGSIYSQPDRWRPLRRISSLAQVKIGFVGRNYSHKNTEMFPRLAQCLRSSYGLTVEFYVTFTDKEWAAVSVDFRKNVRNVGQLSVAQCPAFYDAMDGVIFPSLLECFSAAPLEALAMRKPLFASDRQFNRDICGDYAFYFDPLDVQDAAAKIYEYFSDVDVWSSWLDDAECHARSFSDARARAGAYLDLLVGSADNA